MLGQYLPLAVLLILAGVFVAGSFGTRKLLAPDRRTEAKYSPYESGIVPTREPPERFPVKFALVAMSFIVFDIEIIFLYPWATIYRELGVHGLFAVLLFSVPIVVSLAYEFSKGALDWGPARRRSHRDDMVSSDRTTASTVRRVGLDGREPIRPTEAA
ncbi:MAG: NADH-quinone oxidoreductase subunit A [Acidimicrobiales bacterium]